MNSSIRNKIFIKLTKLVEKCESIVRKENFQDIKWLFDYLEANTMTYGSLWYKIKENIEQNVMAQKVKNSDISRANLCEVEFLRSIQQSSNYDDENNHGEMEKGNRAEILQLLNEAIINCHFKDRKLMARLFYLRSTELAKSLKFKEALQNINFSLKFWSCTKYVLHMISYLHKLGKTKESYKLASLFFNSYQIQNLDDKKLKIFVKKQRDHDEFFLKEQDIEYIFHNKQDEKLREEMDANFEIDHRCSLTSCSGQGRFFMANENIPSGKTIFREQSYSMVFLPDGLWTRCQYCFRSVTNVFYPCVNCTEVVYCGPKCAKKSYDFCHRFECRLNQFWLDRSKSTYHMFKLLNRFGVQKILDLNNESNELGNSYNLETYLSEKKMQCKLSLENEQTKINAYRAFLDLVNHHNKYDLNFLAYHLTNAVECSMVAAIVQGYDLIQMPREKMIQLIEISLKGIRRVVINSFQWDKKTPKGDKNLSLATSLCLIGSLFNHRCDNNVDWTFHNGSIYLNTNRPINKGEEISICYGCGWQSPFEDRLKQNQAYYFQCNCQSCMEDSKTVLAVQCRQCPGPVLLSPPVIYDPKSRDDAICMLCYKTYENTATVYNRLEIIHHQIDLINKLFECVLDKPKYVALLKSYMEELSKILYHRSRILVDYLNECCRVLANLREDHHYHSIIRYGLLIDEILPKYDKELLIDFHNKSNVEGITKMVLNDEKNDGGTILEEIDWMVFWSDVFRKYIQESQDDSLIKVIKRYYLRLFGLLDYLIKRKQQLELLMERNTHISLSMSYKHSTSSKSNKKKPKPPYMIDVEHSEEIKWLKVLRKYKQDELDWILLSAGLDGHNIEPPSLKNIIDLIFRDEST